MIQNGIEVKLYIYMCAALCKTYGNQIEMKICQSAFACIKRFTTHSAHACYNKTKTIQNHQNANALHRRGVSRKQNIIQCDDVAICAQTLIATLFM